MQPQLLKWRISMAPITYPLQLMAISQIMHGTWHCNPVCGMSQSGSWELLHKLPILLFMTRGIINSFRICSSRISIFCRLTEAFFWTNRQEYVWCILPLIYIKLPRAICWPVCLVAYLNGSDWAHSSESVALTLYALHRFYAMRFSRDQKTTRWFTGRKFQVKRHTWLLKQANQSLRLWNVRYIKICKT